MRDIAGIEQRADAGIVEDRVRMHDAVVVQVEMRYRVQSRHGNSLTPGASRLQFLETKEGRAPSESRRLGCGWSGYTAADKEVLSGSPPSTEGADDNADDFEVATWADGLEFRVGGFKEPAFSIALEVLHGQATIGDSNNNVTGTIR